MLTKIQGLVKINNSGSELTLRIESNVLLCTPLCINFTMEKSIPGHTTRRWEYIVPPTPSSSAPRSQLGGEEDARERLGVPSRPVTSY